ncbi:phage tail spike protein [uncultured Anaerococcus sp.]|uniref:phage tail spike protein n=1 Tax=uncultured Anaerococcus sp. TaxID=293428 RepID=UPI00288B0700|nr:phage tail spike protein [uncultured Anaerococcus sp.]
MLYCFDKKENLLREINSDSLVSPIQTESLNSLMILEFGVFVKDIDLMDDVEFVAHKDMENPNRIQMYKVLSSTSEDTYVSYQAIHILFDELKSYGYIRDRRLKQVKASAALEVVLQGSRWKVGICDDSDLLTTNFYDSSRLEALSKVINAWGLDLDFYLTFDGSKISGRYVRLVANRGEDTGERFVYGSNALEVVAEIDKSEIYTRIIPRGRGEEKFDEDGKSKDTFGRRIRIDEVVWSRSKGDPIDKPLGQEYLELKEATKKFGFSDGTPRTKVQVFEDIEKPEDLIKAGYDFLVNISRPLVQFKSKVFKESRTSVGDIVRIIRKDLGIYYMTRIFKVRRNLITKNVEVEFGDKIVKSQLDREKSLKVDIEALKSKQRDMTLSFRNRVTKAMTEAMFNQDGYNYELKKGNEYGLPAGYYSFDRDIDDNPSKVIYVGAGTMAIANSKKSNGDWDFKTFGTGDGFVADLIIAGMIRGGKVRWNLDDGTFLIGDSVDKYTMYWDGSTLYLRNVDIDLSNNYQISEINEKINDSVNNFNTDIVNLDNKLSGLSGSVDDRFTGLSSSVDTKIKEASGETDNKIKELGSKVETKLSNITGEIETVRQDFKVGQGKFESSINTKIKDLSTNVEVNFKDVNKRISGNVTGIANLSSQIKQTESSISQSVSNQITAVRNDVDSKTGNLKSYVDSNYSTKNQVNNLLTNESSKLKTYVQDNYSTKTQTADLIKGEISSVKAIIASGDKDIKSYIERNYSTSTQTNNKIASEISSVKNLIDSGDRDVKSYIERNYSTKTQTSSMISSEVSSKISGVNSQISNLSSRLSQTASELSTKVTNGQAQSIFKQEASKFTFDAKQVNFNSDVDISGTFESKGERYSFAGDKYYRTTVQARNGSINFYRGIFQQGYILGVDGVEIVSDESIYLRYDSNQSYSKRHSIKIDSSGTQFKGRVAFDTNDVNFQSINVSHIEIGRFSIYDEPSCLVIRDNRIDKVKRIYIGY